MATQHLIKAANIRGDAVRIANLALEAVEKIGGKLARVTLERGYFEELSGHRLSFARTYIQALTREFSRAGDKLNVFEGVSRLADLGVILADILKVGLEALQQWWQDVEKRPIVDLAACLILGRQLRRLEKIEAQYANFSRAAPDALLEMDRVRKDLEYRAGMLSKQD